MNPVEIVAIVDRSGSMQSIATDAIGGFNKFLDDQKKQPGEATLTLCLFDHEHLYPYNNQPLPFVAPLTSTTYQPRGNTALYDAIGRTLSQLLARSPERAIVVILTDGYENASTEYNQASVKALITQAEARGWQVHYLGANQDAFAVGAAMGSVRNTTYTATGAGVRGAYASASLCTANYRVGDTDSTASTLLATTMYAPYGGGASSDSSSSSSSDTSTSGD